MRTSIRTSRLRSHGFIVLATLLAPLSMPATSIAQQLSDLATQNYESLSRRPAAWGRLWVLSVYSGMKESCPSNAPEFPDQGRTLEYGFSGGGGINSGAMAIGRNLQVSAFLDTHDGKGEIAGLVARKGCKAGDHKLWIAGATRYLKDPELAGDVRAQVTSMCERSRLNHTDCGCLADTIDFETRPSERRALLSSSDTAASFREILKSKPLGQTVKVVCGTSIPDFGMTEIPVAQRRIASTEYVGRWRHEGRNLMLRCLFKPKGEAQYRARCSKSVNGVGDFFEGDATLDNGVLRVDWQIAAPRELTLQSDGSLKWLGQPGADDAFDLVIRDSL